MTINTAVRLALLASTAFPLSYDPGKAGWKVDADGKLVADANGNPIYVNADGREQVTEAGTISRLNSEAKQHRERAETAEKALEPFKGLDPAAAKEAFDKLSKIDQKKLIDAGEVDKVREEVGKSFTDRLSTAEKERDAANGRADNLLKDTTLRNSKFVQDRIGVPADMFMAQFGQNFKVEDGKLVPYDASGNKVWSAKRAGEIADPDEALEIIVNNYAHKDAILKAPDASGSGGGGGGGNRGGGRFVSRADFAKRSPGEQAQLAEQQSKGEVTITD